MPTHNAMMRVVGWGLLLGATLGLIDAANHGAATTDAAIPLTAMLYALGAALIVGAEVAQAVRDKRPRRGAA